MDAGSPNATVGAKSLLMSKRHIRVAIAATALLSAASGAAHAADKPARPVDFTVRSEPMAAVPDVGRALRMDASKGRFGITLNVAQPSERPAVGNDVQAGAYFRITPSLSVGGAVALGEQELTPRVNQARPADAPKVRLQTQFKF